MTPDTKTLEVAQNQSPLLKQRIVVEETWDELLGAFSESISYRHMLGMLHTGFDVSLRKDYDELYGEEERLIFYLRASEGWNDSELLRMVGDSKAEHLVGFGKFGNRRTRTLSGVRQLLAQKAFNVLCTNYFGKMVRYSEDEEPWVEILKNERLFSAIQNFFRLGKRNDRFCIENLSRINENSSHSEVQAVKFLLDLAMAIFEWGRDTHQWHADERIQKKAQPWMIGVLAYLGELQLLQKEPFDCFEHFHLSDECLAKLEKFSLEEEYWIFGGADSVDFPIESLEKACYLDSQTAQFLKMYLIRKEAFDRQKALDKAEDDLAKARQKVKDLTKK